MKYINKFILWVAFGVVSIFSFAQTTNPTGCAVTGTILYKEDFGGNDPSNTTVRPTGIPQVQGYTYSTGHTPRGSYSITKTSSTLTTWTGWYLNLDDHTFPGDNTRGYFMGFDADEKSGQFYECEINGLCAGVKLYFSVWIVSLLNYTTPPDKTNMTFVIEDTQQNMLDSYNTGNVPDADPNWKQYGFEFTIPVGQNSIVLKIINSGTGSNGNDFAMDDIEIRLCIPPVTLTQATIIDTMLCTGMSHSLEGNYTDDGTFGNNLVYRWEKNTSEDINNPSAWTPITATQGTSNNGTVNSIYTISPVALSDAGYYRLAIANAANINNYNCRAMSDFVHLQMITNTTSCTINADMTICYNTVPAQLTGIINNGTGTYTYQWQKSTDGNTWINVTDGTGGTTLNYTPLPLTQTTWYRLKLTGSTGACNIVYSNTMTVTVHPDLVLSVLTEICPGITTQLIPNTGGVWTVDKPAVLEIVNNRAIIGKSVGTATLTYTNTTTNCSKNVDIIVKDYPEPDDITGKKVVCIGQEIELSNSMSGGVWTKNNSNISIISQTATPAKATVRGVTKGNSYVTYTVSNGECKTKRTFQLKIIPVPTTPPKIIIGVER
ncbi:MAG: hypothetical protein LBG80_01520 [Bacteroidales bacterium]|jgi:hypothetical protein|nr:hypothetical protein [Bacteroidales bacterium]